MKDRKRKRCKRPIEDGICKWKRWCEVGCTEQSALFAHVRARMSPKDRHAYCIVTQRHWKEGEGRGSKLA